MASNTKYDPQNISEFQKGFLLKDANCVIDTVPKGTSKDIDFVITDDSLLTTSCLLIDNAVKGDYWKMQVIHPNLGVVFEPVHKWGVDYKSLQQPVPKANFPAKIFTGLTLRIVYYSTGTENDVWICLNLDKDKINE